MSKRSIRTTLACLAVVGLVALPACSDDSDGAPSLDDPGAVGVELATEFMTALAENDTAALDDFLADGFQIQRADGSAAERDEYLADLPTVESFELGDTMVAVQDGDALTLRWTLVVDETVSGDDGEQQLGTEEAPRLSTFVWRDGRWRMVSHANFNLPQN